MKNIIWNIFVGILLLFAIISDIQMAINTQKVKYTENYQQIEHKQNSIININSEDVLLNEIKKEDN